MEAQQSLGISPKSWAEFSDRTKDDLFWPRLSLGETLWVSVCSLVTPHLKKWGEGERRGKPNAQPRQAAVPLQPSARVEEKERTQGTCCFCESLN